MDGCGGTICSRSALVFHPLLNCSRDFIISYCTYGQVANPWLWSGCQCSRSVAWLLGRWQWWIQTSALVFFEVRTRVLFAAELVVYTHSQAQPKHIADGYLHVLDINRSSRLRQ
jgi:hypothetical protein